MKKMILFNVFIFLQFMASAQEQVWYDDHAIQRSLEGDFKSISISGSIKLVLSQSEKTGIAVSAADLSYQEQIITEIVNNTLMIYASKNRWKGAGKTATVYLSYKMIHSILASGASSVNLVGDVRLPHLKISLSGASKLKAHLYGTSLTLSLSGASEATIAGKTGSLQLVCSGASDLNGFDMQAETCTVVASGASDVKIRVNKELKAVASGASHIYYGGNATITDIKSTGASKVEKKY
jgi:hypothetical protein